MTRFVKLETMPAIGDFVYQNTHGLVKYQVLENDDTVLRPNHPNLVELRVVDNFNHSFYRKGQLCCRNWRELVKLGE